MFYIEVGAHDGLFQSQTINLEKNGWSGLLIEANPTLFKKCKGNRNNKSNIFVNSCLVNKDYKEDTITFYSYDDLGASGRTEQFFVGENIRGNNYTVKAVLLNDILTEHNISEIDFFSIDTEGAELDILSSIDFDKFDFKKILVEIHGKTASKEEEFKIINEMLEPHGFTPIKKLKAQFHVEYIKSN